MNHDEVLGSIGILQLSQNRMKSIINNAHRTVEKQYQLGYMKEIASVIFMWEDDFFSYHCDVQVELEV